MNDVSRLEAAICSGRDFTLLARRLAALGHPARLKILRRLAMRDACCCGEIVRDIDLAQSTVSQHLKVLVEVGLVRYEPDSRRSRYSIVQDALAELGGEVDTLVAVCCRRG